MKKYIILIILIPVLFSGCWLFEDNELADAEMSADIDVVVNENVNIEKEKEVEEEELTIDKVFIGTWELTMNYDEFYTISKMSINKGEYDSKNHYEGTMKSVSGTVYDSDGTYEALEGTGELADYEIDGQKIRISSETSSLWGTINKDTSYASGEFQTTLGSGAWEMSKIK